MATNLRVCVVGAGFISADRHLPFWKSRKDVDLVAICDTNQESATAAERRFNIPNRFSDVDEMLDTCTPDIVDICTPPATHFPLALTAIERGSNVVLEKPMASSGEECDMLEQAAKDKGVKLSVIHNMLFIRPIIRALKIVKEGGIGELSGVRLMMASPAERYLATDMWVHKLAGGLIGEVGPHATYLATAFIGKVQDVHVHARKTSDYPWVKADDFIMTLHGESASASVRISHNSNYYAVDLEVWGTKGRLKIDLQTGTLHRFSRKNLTITSVGRSALVEPLSNLREAMLIGLSFFTRRYQLGHRKFLEEFVTSIMEDTPEPVTPRDAGDTVKTLEQAVKSFESGVTAGRG